MIANYDTNDSNQSKERCSNDNDNNNVKTEEGDVDEMGCDLT